MTFTIRIANRGVKLLLAFLLVVPLTALWQSRTPAHAASSCPTFTVLGSRGSGEAAGLGKPVGAFVTELQNAAKPGGGTVARWANDYPAVPVAGGWEGYIVDFESFVDPLGLPIYQYSVASGESRLAAEIHTVLSGPCGSSTRVILAGYSQGAEVTGNVYQSLPFNVQSKIYGMVLFGDTHFDGQSGRDRGNYDPNRNGIFGSRGDFGGTADILSYCHSLDPVCQGIFRFDPFAGVVKGYDLNQHVNYDTVGDAPGDPTYPRLAAYHFVTGAGLKPPVPAGVPLDLVFVIDSTGSMSPYLAGVDANVQEIVDKTKAASPNVRFGLVDFKDTDQGDPYAARLDVPFTTDTTTLANGVAAIGADGGGDTPEARFSGIMTGLGMPWRSGVRKEIIVMSDAPGKDPEPVTGYTADSVIKAAVAVDPAVVDTLALGTDPTAASFDPQVTTNTGGHLFVGADGSTIAATIIQAVQTTASTPSARITDPGTVGAGTTYSLSAAGSFDPNGEALSYAWDLDGSGHYTTTSSGPVLTGITAGAVGDHQVAVQVTDTDHLVGYGSATVHVVNPGLYTAPPQAPTGITVTPAANRSSVTVAWRAAPSGPPTEAYQVSTEDGLVRAVIMHGGAASLDFPAAQLPLTLKIQALNRVGAGGTAGPVYATVSGPTVTRISGSDRYATAITLSQNRWIAGSADAVVLARGDLFPDALAGVPLAAKKAGPLLLTPPDSLDPRVAAEIRRALPAGGTVYVLGGPGAISPNVQKTLVGMHYRVVRFAGTDRFSTALAIAKSPDGMADPKHVIVATGLNYPDALAAGPFAAGPFATASNQPAAIVLSSDRTLDQATAAYLRTKTPTAGSGPNVAAIGGQAVAAAGTVLRAPAFRALFGADRYATAAAAAGQFGDVTKAGIATGTAFPDALSGGAYMASRGGPILLTDPAGLSAPTARALSTEAAKLQVVEVFGGPVALPDRVMLAIATAVHGTVHP